MRAGLQRFAIVVLVFQAACGVAQSSTNAQSAEGKGSSSAHTHSLRAEVEERRGDPAGAVREYYEAAQIDPSESNIFDLADSLLQHKKYSGYLAEAVKYFRYGVSKFPRSSKLMVGLGVALYASQEYDEAVKVLCAAVDLDPADQRPITFLGMARKVSSELAAQVTERLRAFAERYPNNAAANYEYAMSLWEQAKGEQEKNVSEITALLQRSLKTAPGWYEPHYQLGIVYESQERYADAAREMRKAAELEPGFKPAHFHLAGLYKRLGDNARAIEESKRAQALDNAQIKSEILQPRN